MNEVQFIILDLFCGAGGTTTGFENVPGCLVVGCVNHDHNALKSHEANHLDAEHFNEDITRMYGRVINGFLFMSPEMVHLKRLTDLYRAFYPNAKFIIWASLECTNFSKAKGGQARDADSRTLADHMDRYYIPLEPDYLMFENVVEFMAWGPLDENGKPISRKNGSDWLRWRRHINKHGYHDEWKELNSADFGAYTSRNRLFGICAKDDNPIIWPDTTHAKIVKSKSESRKPGLFDLIDKQPWKPVKDVLDFTDEGKSIFERPKPLSDKTLERIYAGLIKFVAGGKDAFLVKYNSMGKNGTYNAPSIDDPCPVISTQNRLYIANAHFISKYYSGKPDGKNISVDGPAGTVTTVGNQTLISSIFIQKYHGNGDNLHSIESPCPTIATKDQVGLVKPCFIMRDFTTGDNNTSIEQPAGSILPNPKLNLVTPFLMPTNYDNTPVSIEEPAPVITANRKHHYIVNPSYFGHASDIEAPCPVIVARQDKAPLYMVVAAGVDNGYSVAIRLDVSDSEIMRKIKHFMVLYNIIDVKMRMLKILELLRIQGFPAGYKLIGNQSEQKKFIGNAVHPLVPQHMANALIIKLSSNLNKAA